MRLLDCETLQLKTFTDDKIPERRTRFFDDSDWGTPPDYDSNDSDDSNVVDKGYAILSHTLGREEVTFQEMINGQGKSKEGYKKIVGFCSLALKTGHKYGWVNTCCTIPLAGESWGP
jgi:hypothetical protein